jgi:HSP20 family protein
MVTWYYRSVFDELEDMRIYMELLNRQVYGTNPVVLLSPAGEFAIKLLPAHGTMLPVEVSEKADEVVVTAAMIDGTTKKDIALDLINPRTLEITCEQTEERTDENEGYNLRACLLGSMTRIVSLPKPVTDNGSSALFRNGVLEVHLKKATKESRGKIFID